MNFGQTHEVTDRISRIEQSLFSPNNVVEQSPQTASLLDQREHDGLPGVSIAVINQGHIEWAKGYGVQDVETQKPITSDTLFQAASISKSVTAFAVLRLVDAGQLDLDEDVNSYLRSWRLPTHMSRYPYVTLRHVLCHGAGVTVHGFPGYTNDTVLPTLEHILEGQKPANTDPIRVDTPPGAQFRYSGGGYCIVQQILMDVTGQPFPELMQDLVLNPLGMRQSTFEQSFPQALVHTATGHLQGGKPVFGRWQIYPEMAAAGLWTTPSDLARFVLAIQHAWAGETSNNGLSQEMVRQMLKSQVAPFMGLGICLEGEGTSSRFSHTGCNKGFRCLLEAYVHQSFGAVVMTNSDDGFLVIEKIILALAQEYGWPDYLVQYQVF